MTTYSTETPPTTNGTPPPEPPFGAVPLPTSRREEKRRDIRDERAERRADWREKQEERRRNAEHAQQLKEQRRRAKAQARAERKKAAAKSRKERRAAWQTRSVAVQTRLAAHMPLWGLPVVAVSMVVGWTGQASAAAHLGMGWAAGGVPVMTEGMTLTFAGLTGQAIEAKRPYQWLMRATWVTAIVAAAVNASGHLIEDSTPAGVYRAGAYAVASLGALILWWGVMRSKRAAVSGRTAEDVARWRRLRRRHPILVRRARRIADSTGVPMAEAYRQAWARVNGAGPGEPSIGEIKRGRRAAYLRSLAESWDGRRRFVFRDKPVSKVIPAAEGADAEAVDETASAAAPEAIPAPFLPVALAVPGPDGTWVAHRVPVHPLGASRPTADTVPEDATTRVPQGQDPVSQVQQSVADERLGTVRALVAEVAADGGDLMREPSARKTAKALGCRPATTRKLLAKVLAEHGVTRPRRH
ncbi:hypothetical protein ACH4NT_36625 [Streptomyces lydicus]|uniref:hypothetical protein n=1 Tax=Streptomyces lydicus TaxID=47763 RepID=UPI0037ABD256